MTFLRKLRSAQETNGSWLCVGLDPVMARMPEPVRTAESPFLAFGRAIVEATAGVACAFKPNLAFWLVEGPAGLAALRQLIDEIPNSLPVILDAKFNDVGHTAEAYAQVAFDQLGADACTTNPYLGLDGVQPFLAQPDRGAFLLARTSNPSAPDLQDRPLQANSEGRYLLYEEVARLAAVWDGRLPGTCGLVVGATYPEELAHLRQIAPQLPFLIPGVGTQGGGLEAPVAHGPTTTGVGPVINSSRGIIYASDGADFAAAARAAATALRDQINQYRE